MLSYALGNRFKAFLAGVGVTSILQSSTATGLMVTAFAAGGLVDLVPALAVMLGANVGTTPAHGSRATWIAIPSSQWTFTTYSLPVSRRTPSSVVDLAAATSSFNGRPDATACGES